MLITCSSHAQDTFDVCPPHAHHKLASNLTSAHHMFHMAILVIMCSSYAHHKLATNSTPAHSMLHTAICVIAYKLYSQNLLTTCSTWSIESSHAHHMLTTPLKSAHQMLITYCKFNICSQHTPHDHVGHPMLIK